MLNAVHYWQRIRQKNKIPSDVRKLRLFLDQYLDTHDFYLKALEEYKNTHTHTQEIAQCATSDQQRPLVPPASCPEPIPELNICMQFKTPPDEDSDAAIENENENENVVKLPEDIAAWVKKVYKWTALNYHPDKTGEGKEWFQYWLSAYTQGDWVLFIIYLENIEKIWEKYPPPKTFGSWVMSYINIFINNEQKIVTQKEYTWWYGMQTNN